MKYPLEHPYRTSLMANGLWQVRRERRLTIQSWEPTDVIVFQDRWQVLFEGTSGECTAVLVDLLRPLIAESVR